MEGEVRGVGLVCVAVSVVVETCEEACSREWFVSCAKPGLMRAEREIELANLARPIGAPSVDWT